MMRTKWMRLGVRDPADILRWAATQNTRQLDDFRYRMIRGREFVSFRMVPRYAIRVGTSDIVVVAHVKATAQQYLRAIAAGLWRKAVRGVLAVIASRPSGAAEPTVARSAALYDFAAPRLSSPSRG